MIECTIMVAHASVTKISAYDHQFSRNKKKYFYNCCVIIYIDIHYVKFIPSSR